MGCLRCENYTFGFTFIFLNAAWLIWYLFSFRLLLFCVFILKCLVWQLPNLSVPHIIAICENTAIVKWIRCTPFWTCALYVFGHITHTMNNVCIFPHDKGTRGTTAMHCIALHCIALHYFALHCIALHCIALHCIALHCIALHCITLHCIALHCIALHCIALHCIALHCIAWD